MISRGALVISPGALLTAPWSHMIAPGGPRDFPEGPSRMWPREALDVSFHSRGTVFPALPRLSSRGSTHIKVARGTALWESLLGKPQGKALRESHRSLDPSEGKRDTAATFREESGSTSPQSRRGLTPLVRLQNTPRSMSAPERNPQVPAPTPHKVLGPGIDRRGIPRCP